MDSGSIINSDKNENTKKSILFLHGYTQNSLIIQKRLKVLTKAINQTFPNLNLIFPDAPFKLEENFESVSECLEEIKRGWLYLNENDKMKNDNFLTDQELNYLGLETSLASIIDISSSNDIHCIFGFSQGALIAIILSILISKGEAGLRKHFPNLKCIIIVSGFFHPFPKNEEIKFYLSNLHKAYSYSNSDSDSGSGLCEIEDKHKIDIPLLNVYGVIDEFILPDKSQKVGLIFKNVDEYAHKGKHFIPTAKEDVQMFINYIKKFIL